MVCLRGVGLLVLDTKSAKECTWGCVKKERKGGGGGAEEGVPVNYLSTESTGDRGGEKKRNTMRT